MSTETPSKRHRQTRSVALSTSTTTSLHNPQNPYHLASQSSAQNSASEVNLPVQPSTPPRTPRKDGPSTSQNKSSSVLADSGPKNKTRNKNRPKNVNTSPAVPTNETQTPPLPSAGMQSSRPVTTPSAAAYAGPTFHASPAPSALPIPSFYSKSVPDSPGLRGLKQSRDISISSNSEVSNASLSEEVKGFQREESPLDLFFRADREEKARARSASSAQNAINATGPFCPPLSPRSSRTPPASTLPSRSRWSQDNRSSSGGIFAFEMDSPTTNKSPFGPAFSTPYNERINAARGSNQTVQSQSSPSQVASNDRSALLKAYLFNGPQPQAVPSAASHSATNHSQFQRGNFFASDFKSLGQTPRINGRSSGLRQEVSPTKTPTKSPDRNGSFNSSPTPSRLFRDNSSNNTNKSLGIAHETFPIPSSPSDGLSSGSQGADLRDMEDSLRKILKLDSAGGSGAFGSIVNGGRTPPSSGINGVTRS